jgi:hypothetical protein
MNVTLDKRAVSARRMTRLLPVTSFSFKPISYLTLNSHSIQHTMDVKPADIKPAVGEQTTWPFPVEIQEQLAIDQGKSVKNVWALKLPRFLLERWERVPEAGVELGTLVVDSSYGCSSNVWNKADKQDQPPNDPPTPTGRSLSRRPTRT